MMTLQNYINADMLNWFQANNIKYTLADVKQDKGALNVLYNDKYCIKMYDRFGHGFGVAINAADKYDESIYDNDSFSLHWVFRYLNLKETALFDKRTESQYLQNLPNLITDIKNIIPRLNQMTSLEWYDMIEWIDRESKKQFS